MYFSSFLWCCNYAFKSADKILKCDQLIES